MEQIMKVPHLGRAMPADLPSTVTVADHFRAFYCFDTTDVWTADGWLVTAVQDNGTHHHLRRDDQKVIRAMQPDEVLHFAPTPKTRHYGFN